MSSIVFLVIWLYSASPEDNNSPPMAQFLTSYHSMKECTSTVATITASKPELKGRVSCLNVVPVADDASESL